MEAKYAAKVQIVAEHPGDNHYQDDNPYDGNGVQHNPHQEQLVKPDFSQASGKDNKLKKGNTYGYQDSNDQSVDIWREGAETVREEGIYRAQQYRS